MARGGKSGRSRKVYVGPYTDWNDGRPRWNPGPRLRKAGFVRANMTEPDGSFMAFERARATAADLHAIVTAHLDRREPVPDDLPLPVYDRPATGRPRATPHTGPALEAGPDTAHQPTVDQMWAAWQDDRSWRNLAAKTRADHRNKLTPFLAWAGAFPPGAVTRRALSLWYEAHFDMLYATRGLGLTIEDWQALPDDALTARGNAMHRKLVRELRDAALEDRAKTPGHAMANGIMRTVSSLFSYGVREGWAETNPAKGQNLKQVRPDVRPEVPGECLHMVRTADAMGLHSVADAIASSLALGQRLADTLALPANLTEDKVARICQGKTGAVVNVSFTRAYQRRLGQIRERRNGPTNITHLIANEATGLPYRDTWEFWRVYDKVRAAAAETLPSVATLTMRHMRPFAVIRMADGGATVAQIAAVTGHSLQTVHNILKHYNRATDRQAAGAIAAMETWFDETGEVI